MSERSDMVLTVAKRLRDAGKEYESVHIKEEMAGMIIDARAMYQEQLAVNIELRRDNERLRQISMVGGGM